ncbi:MAG TPA: hypothetical protein PKZ97_11015, partial [Azospirillaceae bacterium]|nr:hypothetical protein [Azospirillaceae bacterium]
ETAGAAERLETAARMQAEGRWSGLAQDLPRLRAALDIPAPNDFTPDGVRRSVAELANKSLSIEQATKILRADSRHLRETCRDDGAALAEAAKLVFGAGQRALGMTEASLRRPLEETLERARAAAADSDIRLKNLGEDAATLARDLLTALDKLTVEVRVAADGADALFDASTDLPRVCDAYKALAGQ